MLYLLHGPEIHVARKKARTLIEQLLTKKPDAAHFRFDDETFDVAQLEEHVGSQGLFAERSLIVLDGTFKNEEAQEVVMEKVEQVAESDNIFILIEEKIEKKHLTKLARHAEKVEVFQGKKVAATKGFNVFSLSEAFGMRDKGNLWVLYHKAQRAGIAPEEMYNILLWQLKVMLQVARGDESDLKPFVASKAKRFIKNYSENELQKMASNLVSLYHDTRRGIVDFGLELERFIITLG